MHHIRFHSQSIKRFAILISLSLVAILALTGIAHAAQEKVSSLAKDQTFTGMYTRAADTVTVDGTVYGDVWVAGSHVSIHGRVDGNVYAVGSSVEIDGIVTGSVHAAGSKVSVAGQVGGSAYLAGSDVSVAQDANIRGAVAAAGSDLIIGGSIGQQLYAAGSHITVSSQVGQSARLAGGTIVLTDQATIAGNLKYSSSSEATIANDKAISGGVTREAKEEQSKPEPWSSRILGALFGYVVSLVTAAGLLYFAPRVIESAKDSGLARPGLNLAKGVMFLIAVPILLILGILTIIGIPLVILAALVYIAIIIVAPTITSYAIGSRIYRPARAPRSRFVGSLTSVALGLLVVTILTTLPFIGGLLSFIACAFGAGALISRGFTPLQLKKHPASPTNPHPHTRLAKK